MPQQIDTGSESSVPVTEFFVPIRIEREFQSTALTDFVWVIRRRWIFVVASTVTLGVLAFLWTLTIEPVYRASVVVAPVRAENSAGPLSAIASQLGGLASLAGIGLGSSEAQETRAVALLGSRQIGERFIEEYGLLPQLFAKDWNVDSSSWRRIDDAPTLEDGYLKFDREVREVTEDRQTGLITVTIEWYDPLGASEMANAMIVEVNQQMRQQAIEDASRSISYLNTELKKTELVEMRGAIFRLIEAQLQSIMVANAREEFALSVIDPAKPSDPDRYVWPKRVWVSATGAFLGFLMAAIVAWWRERHGPLR